MISLTFLLLSLFLGRTSTTGISQLSDPINCFTIDLYKSWANSSANVISSPFSADVVLSLLLMGASGNTALQLRKALGYENQKISNSDVKNEFKSILTSLTSDGNITMKIANSMWIKKGISLNPDFLKDGKNYFLASIDSSMPFKDDPQNATDIINHWAENNTDGLIKKIYDNPLPLNTIMVLANALYFKGNWLKKFNTKDTLKQIFYNGDTVQDPEVPFMVQLQKFPYKYDTFLKSKILEMPYEGGQISMVIMLPDGLLTDLEQNLDCQTLQNTLKGLIESLVQVMIPKFETESKFDVKSTLESLGVRDLSNLSKMEFGSTSRLEVGDIVQKAAIKVYEEGSEAAAVTAARVCRSCTAIVVETKENFRADRPFIYFIIEKATGIILFVGRVSKF